MCSFKAGFTLLQMAEATVHSFGSPKSWAFAAISANHIEPMNVITPQTLDQVASYNEAEVRFHIVDPILRELGYPGDEGVYLKLEEKLEYPYYFIGHRNRAKDLPLGFPDYRAGLKGRRGSFIVEAKSASQAITKNDVEQAHSYAAHSQVGANYFVLSNGLKFGVYETLSGGQSEPVVEISIDEINARFHEIENILSPANLEGHCTVSYDKHLKLGEGLSSRIQIRSGKYDVKEWRYRFLLNDQDVTSELKRLVPQFSEIDDQLAMIQRDFELRISEGDVERDPNGRIFARVSFDGVTKNNSEAMKMLGVDTIIFSTDSEFISEKSEYPTVFESTADFALDEGTMVPPMFGNAIPLDSSLEGDILVNAHLYKDQESVLGNYIAVSDFRVATPMGEAIFEFDFIGNCVLRLLP